MAVVVLGFSCNHRAATPSDPLKHRLAHAADVAVAARADTVVCSGGLDAGQVQTYPSEGEIMAAWMSALPVMQRARADPSSRLVVLPERKSVSTRENALFSLQLLAQQVRCVVVRTVPLRFCWGWCPHRIVLSYVIVPSLSIRI